MKTVPSDEFVSTAINKAKAEKSRISLAFSPHHVDDDLLCSSHFVNSVYSLYFISEDALHMLNELCDRIHSLSTFSKEAAIFTDFLFSTAAPASVKLQYLHRDLSMLVRQLNSFDVYLLRDCEVVLNEDCWDIPRDWGEVAPTDISGVAKVLREQRIA